MAYLHRSARRPTSRTLSARNRRLLFAERLEDRSLMAADLLSAVQNNSLNLLNAEGEAGSSLPNKVSYSLEILDSSGNALTTANNRTATISKGADFYLQFVGQDIRPNGLDPVLFTPLVRGVFAAYTDILYDKNFATIAANETQSIKYGSADQTGTFTLTLPANASGKSGTTAPISFNRADNAGTAKNIKDALNTTLFGSATANGVKVVFNQDIFSPSNSRFDVTFVGINNTSLPLMTSSTGDVTIAEVFDGASPNTLAAVQYELDASGSQRYGVDHQAAEAPFGINDIGGFSFSSTGFGTTALPVLRIHMIAALPSGSSQTTVTFTPDPITDMPHPQRNTLVYGNENVKDPNGAIDPNTGQVMVAEIEKSLVQYAPVNNEFLKLTGVTLSITSPAYQAVPDTGYSVAVNHAAGDNSVTIPVLTNDTTTGFSGTPVKEIKSFDSTTTGGTITKVGNNLVFTPSVDFSGTATFSYTGGVVGDNSTTATSTVTVSVAELPKKVTYSLEILDSNGNPLTSANNRTATVPKGSDFYVQFVGQDIRQTGGVHGVFAAYTDILYDTNYAKLAANEAQSISIQGTDQTGSFTLTLPENPSGKSGTTAPINFNKADKTGTAKNIQEALNTTLFGSATANGVKVIYDGDFSRYKATFAGINNVSLPLMTDNSSDVQIGEIVDGAPSDAVIGVAALQDELDDTGSVRYAIGRNADLASFGLSDVGAFTSFSKLSSSPLPIVRIHMIATLPADAPQSVVFTPDPLGDALGIARGIQRPAHNTLVYGGLTSDEIDQSLVKFSPTANEFQSLIGVTLSISNPIYTAVPDTDYAVNQNHAGGTNSVTIPVLGNDTTTNFPGSPAKEIKSFDATTTGGTITKDGDKLVFTPSVDFSGTATFTYVGGVAGDNSTTATGTVTVTVNPVNRAPTCNFGPAQNTDDEQGLTTVSGWMTNCSANDPGQKVSFSVGTDKPELFTVVPGIDETGKLSFDPAPNVSGTAKVTVTIKDDGGTANGGVDQTQVELQFTVAKKNPFFNAAETGDRRGLDVTGSNGPDGQIVAEDVLAVINYINAHGSGTLPTDGTPDGSYVDVDGDGEVVPFDVILIINYINAHPGQSEGEATSHSAISADSSDDTLLLIATDIASQAKRTRRA